MKKKMTVALLVFAVVVAMSAVPAYAGDTLNPGEMLKRGDYLTSGNQRYRLVLERDGNLILIDAGGHPIWATNTRGQGVEKCIMQPDGNLVLYTHNDQPVWAANTDGRPGAFLVLQDDGNLVIYQPQPVWASNTARGQRDERRGRWGQFFDQRNRDRWEERGRQ